MIVGVPREIAPRERRVALTPDAVGGLVRAGLELRIEAGAGAAAGYPDSEYKAAGASLARDGRKLLGQADVVLKVQAPRKRPGDGKELDDLRAGSVLIGLLRPLDDPKLARDLARRGITSFALELLPRITRAQAMDVLSSQANLAGYRSVLVAAAALSKAFPMMVTAAGTISPARVLVIGAGVAGLQAIATARRLGAIVEAYDVRPVVKEQVESLGARFVEVPVPAEAAEDAGGYAREQSEEVLRKQREVLDQRVGAADVVITTALVPGRQAPRLIEKDTVRSMRPGSVIVDLAAEQGGNCAATRADQEVEVDGVTVLGPTNLPSEVAFHASQMYARNVASFLSHLVGEGELKLDLDDEVTREPLLTHDGEITNELVRASAQSRKREGGRS